MAHFSVRQVTQAWATALVLCGWPLLEQASGQDWAQFRGPSGQGIAPSSSTATEWGMEKNMAWQATLPGAAWSQPVAWGDKIYVTTAITEKQTKPKPQQFGGGGGGGFRPGGGEGPPGGEGRPGGGFGGGRGGFGGGRGGAAPDVVYQWKVLCLESSTGKIVWEKLAHEGKPTIPTHRTNTYASETPVTDGERLYAYFGPAGLFCYDLSGKLLWQKEIGSFSMMNGWGTGSSPVLAGDRLFIQCDNEEKSFLVAFNKVTGEELWRESRDEKSNWSTPYLWKNSGRTELIASGGTKMRSYDPVTGKLLWELGGMRGRSSATAVGNDEMLFLGTGGGPGGGGPLMAVKAGAKGDITLEGSANSNEFVAWMAPRSGPSMSSPLLYEGCLYILDQRGGIVSCINAKTGEQNYRERISGAKGFTSSPWASGGKIFCLDEDGQTAVLQAGASFKLLRTNKLDDMFWSSAAFTGNKLLLRGAERLYCITP